MKNGQVCNEMCLGCWSNGSTDCQLCKTYKLEDRCVNECGQNESTYIANRDTRECRYCHSECKNGCSGPVI